MRKFYAFFAAALMSASLYAAAPTAADLAAIYDVNNNVVLCVEFVDEAVVCHDIRFVGTPNNWGKGDTEAESWDNCDKFAPVPGFDGWYAAELAFTEGASEEGWPNTQGKPLQEPEDRHWTWDFQCGDAEAWVHVAGNEMSIKAGFSGECDLGYLTTGAYIYQLKYWKNHKSPCVEVKKHNYTVKMYAPDACEEYKPAIIGDFNNWSAGVAMNEELDDDFETVYTYTFEDEEGHGFKIKDVADTDWSNQMQWYDEENDKWNNFDNYELGAEETIVLDWADNEKFRFALCNGEEPVPVVEANVIAMIIVPAGAPAAGVEIIGSFDGWSGTAMTLQNGVWGIILEAIKNTDEFKIREAGTWDNQIQYNGVNLENIKFGEVWIDGALIDELYADYKIVALDFSGEGYAWTTPEQGIENITLTEKAQKVMVDGVIYIVRDGKMFNAQGTQVR